LIKKERKKPIKLKKLAVLKKRLYKNHPKWPIVAESLAKGEAGFRGEVSLDYQLTFLPDNNYYIFHDLRLKDEKLRYFQLDTLILTLKFHLLIEIKNIAGTLFFDQEFHQLIRTFQNENQTFPDPLLQIRRQQIQLRSWIKQKNFPQAPIIPFVIISSPTSTIQTNLQSSHLLQNVIHSGALPFKIEELEKKSYKVILTKKELNAMARKLLKSHEPYNPDILATYQLSKKDIIKGVYCEKCSSFLMRRNRGHWRCETCWNISTNAHLSALRDYSLLFGQKIMNAECRSFLGIESESVARKILTSTCIKSLGENKNRTYLLPIEDEP